MWLVPERQVQYTVVLGRRINSDTSFPVSSRRWKNPMPAPRPLRMHDDGDDQSRYTLHLTQDAHLLPPTCQSQSQSQSQSQKPSRQDLLDDSTVVK